MQKLSESEETYLVTKVSQVASLAEGSISVADAENENTIYVTNTTYGYEVEVNEELEAKIKGINEAVPEAPEVSDDEEETITIADGDNTEGEADKTIDGKTATYSNPIIPAGFKAVDSTIDSTINANASWTNGEGYKYGLVIEDKEGNQFVWIAVDGANVKLDRYQFEDSLNNNSVSYTKFSEILDDIWAQKVATYGGYYIGRYETQYSNNKCVVKKGNVPTVNITKDTAQGYAQGMDTAYGYTTVTTDLLNSYMWDTALKYIDYYTNSNFSTTTGLGNAESINGGAIESGSYSNDIKCNIADISVNVCEWTTEYYSSSHPCVLRGGAYGSSHAACRRNYTSTNSSAGYIGFRCALYW